MVTTHSSRPWVKGSPYHGRWCTNPSVNLPFNSSLSHGRDSKILELLHLKQYLPSQRGHFTLFQPRAVFSYLKVLTLIHSTFDLAEDHSSIKPTGPHHLQKAVMKFWDHWAGPICSLAHYVTFRAVLTPECCFKSPNWLQLGLANLDFYVEFVSKNLERQIG